MVQQGTTKEVIMINRQSIPPAYITFKLLQEVAGNPSQFKRGLKSGAAHFELTNDGTRRNKIRNERNSFQPQLAVALCFLFFFFFPFPFPSH
ncbi:hypothetical protein BDV24DRAFT_127801, partial [Aspergillus arachidicola]